MRGERMKKIILIVLGLVMMFNISSKKVSASTSNEEVSEAIVVKVGSNLNDYVEFLYKNPTYRWRAITGAYDAGLKPGEQLIEYYDPNDPVNEYGYSDPR